MNVLVLNCGSSSLKFQIFETSLEAIENNSSQCLLKGLIERIGSQALLTFEVPGQNKIRQSQPIKNHRQAINDVLQWIISDEANIPGINSYSDIHAVGHRVVHGGEFFSESTLINDEVIRGIEQCMELAPLHNPVNLKGIESVKAILGKHLPQVAVFDTAFHSTMTQASYLYAIPYQLYRRYKIRRYGFHGTSHRYIGFRYRRLNQLEKNQVNILSIHLGNGCSACLIQNGESVETSMGFTPLEGLAMGTRAGDIDASVLEYLNLKEGMDFPELDSLLNKRSGLLGISGLTSDMRELIEEEKENQDRRATLAIDIFCKRIRKYIGAYYVECAGKIDAIVFTGGIGENAAIIRQRICEPLTAIGVHLDDDANNHYFGGKEGKISDDKSTLPAWVIPTNEELFIARDTARAVEQNTHQTNAIQS